MSNLLRYPRTLSDKQEGAMACLLGVVVGVLGALLLCFTVFLSPGEPRYDFNADGALKKTESAVSLANSQGDLLRLVSDGVQPPVELPRSAETCSARDLKPKPPDTEAIENTTGLPCAEEPEPLQVPEPPPRENMQDKCSKYTSEQALTCRSSEIPLGCCLELLGQVVLPEPR